MKNNSPSRMNEEEKMIYKNRLFREADELSVKIYDQIKDCKVVRQGIQDQISEVKKLLEIYYNEEEECQERMKYRKQVCKNSRFQYDEMA